MNASASFVLSDGRTLSPQDVATQLPTCLVCAHATVLVGCFIPHPHRARAFLAMSEPLVGPVRPGAQRVAWYGLCAVCVADPATAARVEARFLGPEPRA